MMHVVGFAAALIVVLAIVALVIFLVARARGDVGSRSGLEIGIAIGAAATLGVLLLAALTPMALGMGMMGGMMDMSGMAEACREHMAVDRG